MSTSTTNAILNIGWDFTMLEEEAKEVKKTGEEVEKQVKRSTQSALAAARRAVQLTQLFLVASGVAIDQTLLVLSEAVILAAESITAIAAAESLTVVGALTAGIKLVAAGALLLQIQAINRGKQEASTRFAAAGAGLRALGDVL
jgi:hypothetical protein